MIHENRTLFIQYKNELQSDKKTIKHSRVDVYWKDDILNFDEISSEKENTNTSTLKGYLDKISNIVDMAYTISDTSKDNPFQDFVSDFDESEYYYAKTSYDSTLKKRIITETKGNLKEIPFDLEKVLDNSDYKGIFEIFSQFNCVYDGIEHVEFDEKNNICVWSTAGVNTHSNTKILCIPRFVIFEKETEVNPKKQESIGALCVPGVYMYGSSGNSPTYYRETSLNLDQLTNVTFSKILMEHFYMKTYYFVYAFALTFLSSNENDEYLGFVKINGTIYFLTTAGGILYNEDFDAQSFKKSVEDLTTEEIHEYLRKELYSTNDGVTDKDIEQVLTVCYEYGTNKSAFSSQQEYEKNLFRYYTGILPDDWKNFVSFEDITASYNSQEMLGNEYAFKEAKAASAEFEDKDLEFVGYSQENYNKL